jgi:hypothetical protein
MKSNHSTEDQADVPVFPTEVANVTKQVEPARTAAAELASAGAVMGGAVAEILALLQRQEQSVAQGFQQLHEHLDAVVQQPAPVVMAAPQAQAVPVAQPVTAVAPNLPVFSGADQSDLQQIVFGQDEFGNPLTTYRWHELFRDLELGENRAKELVGQLLLFGSVGAERMPQVLKDVGEAFYRWRPHAASGSDPTCDALLDWLGIKCKESGVTNTIEIVFPGDRFDPARHTAKERGNQVTAVQGWIVLRDNGKVYTKASVTVR